MKPILFNAEMVRAILDGRKTVTRRVVKHGGKPPLLYGRDQFYKLVEELNGKPFYGAGFYKNSDVFEIDGAQHIDAIYFKSPYRPSDILYVRETFVKADDGYHYRADATPGSEQLRKAYGYKYRPSIHMPREAARIFLRVTDVRVERLQEIECIATEGVTMVSEDDKRDPRYYFAKLWDGTIKPTHLPLYGWAANPWVWVISFERCAKEDHS